ncbi:MAG: GGDEF domain-containing protein [Planctomycetes bacterium]|nr:GGDEF domain-containing protein [Planctomycetota bacterium]
MIAKTISDAVQNRGLVCRTGGEEITVFFPGVGAEQAAKVCEEVRIAVEEVSVDTRDNDGKPVTIKITISAGVSTNLGPDDRVARESVQDVVSCADRGLYAAKENGRNCVSIDKG